LHSASVTTKESWTGNIHIYLYIYILGPSCHPTSGIRHHGRAPWGDDFVSCLRKFEMCWNCGFLFYDIYIFIFIDCVTATSIFYFCKDCHSFSQKFVTGWRKVAFPVPLNIIKFKLLLGIGVCQFAALVKGGFLCLSSESKELIKLWRLSLTRNALKYIYTYKI